MGQNGTDLNGRKEEAYRKMAGSTAASRWDEQKELAIREACRPHGISAIGEAVLHRVQKDHGFCRKPLPTPRNYSSHQLAAALGRSRKAVEVQLKRMTSVGLALLIKKGDRGRKRASIWELPLVGPTFSDVVAASKARGREARNARKSRRSAPAENGRTVPLSPSVKKKSTSSPQATPKGPAKPKPVGLGPEEQALVEATAAAGCGKGGAVTAVKALRGMSLDGLKSLTKHISQVLEFIRQEPSTTCEFKVFVARCKNGRGQELIELAQAFAQAAGKKAEEEATEAAKKAAEEAKRPWPVGTPLPEQVAFWLKAKQAAVDPECSPVVRESCRQAKDFLERAVKFRLGIRKFEVIEQLVTWRRFRVKSWTEAELGPDELSAHFEAVLLAQIAACGVSL